MNSTVIQLLVLAGIAIFLILKLRSVLGTRDGFEKPPISLDDVKPQVRRDFEVIEGGGVDRDITDHVSEGSSAAAALAEMKRAEPDFAVTPFLQGARGAYEMILMAFERGELEPIKGLLAPEVHESFAAVVSDRERQGLTIEATFVGLKELTLQDATFDTATKTAEITVRYVGELTSLVRNKAGEIVEGDARTIKRQRDVWTFARKMGAEDPNWQLVATDD